MKSGVCPQCGSATVHTSPNGIGFATTTAVNLYFDDRAHPSTTMGYVCVTCGAFQVYLTSTSVLGELAQKWPKVHVK